MAEPTLALNVDDLEAEVGLFLGYGRGAKFSDPAWSTQQQAIISSLRKSGERQFYFTPAAPDLGIEAGYNWSFLKPVATLTLASGASTLQMPDDFGGVEGDITLSLPTGVVWWPVRYVGVGQVLAEQAKFPTQTGRPWLCCVEPLKGTSALAGQRSQLRFWPLADQAYTLKLQYYVNADATGGAFPYCLGGAEHAETLKASCIAAAELYLDDVKGPRFAHFRERLAASVAVDRRKKPQTLGPNLDRSDWQDDPNSRRPHGWSPVSIQGVIY